MNGRFWRKVLVIVVSAFIISVGATGWSTMTLLDDIETSMVVQNNRLSEIDRRLAAIEEGILQRLIALEFQRRGRP